VPVKRILSLAFMGLVAGAAAAQDLNAPPAAFAPNEGIVRGVDKGAGEIIIRHGPLPQMDMPPMTMAFEVNDAKLLDKVKPGDRVTFRVELLNGRFTLTEIKIAYAQQGDDYIKADRPGIADSSEVIGPGRIQVETGLQREAGRAGDDPQRKVVLPTLLRVGISERWEARLESDLYAWMRQADGQRVQAYAPASLGFKYHFLDGDGTPSLGVIARLSPPSGSDALRTRRTTGDVRFAADWELTPQWSLNPNIGLAIDEDDEGRRFSARLFAMTLAYQPARNLELFADMAVQSPEAKGGRSALIYDAGFAYLLNRDVQLDASIGVRGAGSTPPRSFLAAGVSFRF
jgi:Cu/Ag efflux protein CusF